MGNTFFYIFAAATILDFYRQEEKKQNREFTFDIYTDIDAHRWGMGEVPIPPNLKLLILSGQEYITNEENRFFHKWIVKDKKPAVVFGDSALAIARVGLYTSSVQPNNTENDLVKFERSVPILVGQGEKFITIGVRITAKANVKLKRLELTETLPSGFQPVEQTLTFSKQSDKDEGEELTLAVAYEMHATTAASDGYIIGNVKATRILTGGAEETQELSLPSYIRARAPSPIPTPYTGMSFIAGHVAPCCRFSNVPTWTFGSEQWSDKGNKTWGFELADVISPQSAVQRVEVKATSAQDPDHPHWIFKERFLISKQEIEQKLYQTLMGSPGLFGDTIKATNSDAKVIVCLKWRCHEVFIGEYNKLIRFDPSTIAMYSILPATSVYNHSEVDKLVINAIEHFLKSNDP